VRPKSKVRFITFDPIKELADIMERNRIRPKESLPRAIFGPRESLDEREERGWFGCFMESKAKCHRVALDLWQFLHEWFDSLGSCFPAV
jgi:hypothetical protein